MYEYEELKQSIDTKREEDFKALKAEINGLESFFEKCFKDFKRSQTDLVTAAMVWSC